MTRHGWIGWAAAFVVGWGACAARAEDKDKPETTTDAIRVPGTVAEFQLVKLPAGKVTIKDADGKDKEVEIKPIWIGQYEVTWDQYDVFWQRLDLTPAERKAGVDAENRPSKPYIPPDRNWGHDGSPAGSMFCKEAKRYCAWLSKKTGHKYRLPTEAEWEYACRAGGQPLKPGKPELKQVAWYADNSDAQTHPVGKKSPNRWGLYDMLGNVAEWVTTLDDKEAAAGGGYADEGEDVHSARRETFGDHLQRNDSQDPKGKSWLADGAHLGFRVVRED
jgi:formylglycine-generating enzyme